jgi:hypothetical protein
MHAAEKQDLQSETIAMNALREIYHEQGQRERSTKGSKLDNLLSLSSTTIASLAPNLNPAFKTSLHRYQAESRQKGLLPV